MTTVPVMPVGNCLAGVLVLAARDRFRGRIVARWRRGRLVPHFLYVTPEGVVWHYRVVRDIVPSPLHWVLFAGEFHSFPRRRSRGLR